MSNRPSPTFTSRQITKLFGNIHKLLTSTIFATVRLQLVIFSLFLLLSAYAQQHNGLVTDNYSGTIGIQNNPANLADSRFRFNMNVLGINAHAQQNYLQLEAPHSIYKFLNWKWDSTFGTQNTAFPFEETYVKERLNGRDKFAFSNACVNALSMQLGLKDGAGFSFGMTTKAYANVSNLPEAAIKTFLQDLDKQGYIKENQRRILGENIDVNASAAALAYQQYSARYAFVANERKSNFIKIGLGLDYNIGLYGGYAKLNDVSYTLDGIDTLTVNSGEIEMAYIDPNYLTNSDRRLNDYFGKSRLGRGVGINAGIVYEHRSDNKAHKYKMDRKHQVDNSTNKYNWKLGASIVDLGFVNFNNEDAIHSLTVSTSSPLQWSNFDSADTWSDQNDLDSFANNFFSSANRDNSFRMFTPATLRLSGDYRVQENIYIAANYTQSLIRNNSKGVRLPSFLTVTPRYESRWLSVGLPISVSSYYNKINIGTYIRTGVFYIGSDNLGGFLTGKKTNGANIYTGVNWPIHYKKLKDQDGDGVSDELDECPSVVGSPYTNGCPDSDGDKVADDKDLCPEIAGKKRTDGCPDKDEDGTADIIDKCPDTYGSKKSNGCPDSDGDGIHDGIDKCPDIAGEEQFEGCVTKQVEDQLPTDDIPTIDTITTDKPITEDAKNASKFDSWDFATYEYWPVLGAYNDPRWAEELQNRLNTKLNINTTVKTIPGVSKYYVTLGQATTLAEAKEIQKLLDKPSINQELNGSLWWKKVQQ